MTRRQGAIRPRPAYDQAWACCTCGGIAPHALFAVLLTFLLAFALVTLPGCAREDSTAQSEYSDNLVAARISDEVITEGDVTNYITEYREAVNLTDDATWAEYLSSTGESAQDYRERTINQLAIERLFDKSAKAAGISVDKDAVQQNLDSLRAAYNATDDETWKEVKAAFNLDEDMLRKSYERQNLKSQVYAHELEQVEAADDDVASYIDAYLLDTRAFNLLRLEGTNYLPLQNELVRIGNSADQLAAFNAAQINDDAHAEDYLVRDDVGWVLADGSGDTWTSVMEDTSIPGLRERLYYDGITQQILYASEPYTFANGAKDIASMPAALKEAVRANATAKLWDEACAQWLQSQLAGSLTINDAPMHLPYDVQ